MFDPHLHQFPHLKRSGDVFPHPVYWLLQFTEAKVYHNKLVNIRKEMILIHERTTKLKVISFNTSSFTPQRPCLLYDLRHRLCMCMYKDILELLIVLSYFVAPPSYGLSSCVDGEPPIVSMWFQKRALKLQQHKQKEALEREHQREKELERERQLIAKPAKRT